jgi:putative transcriptional regulator
LASVGGANLDAAYLHKEQKRRPLTRGTQEIKERDSGEFEMNKRLFDELAQSIREAGQIRRGELKPGRVFRFDPKNDIAKLRNGLGLSQAKFAAVLGISENTLQNWEQGRRKPTGPAKVLLRIAAKHPDLLLEVA